MIRLPSISERERWLNSSDMMFCACAMQLSQMCPVIPAINTLVSCLSRPQNEHLMSFLSIGLGCIRTLHVRIASQDTTKAGGMSTRPSIYTLVRALCVGSIALRKPIHWRSINTSQVEACFDTTWCSVPTIRRSCRTPLLLRRSSNNRDHHRQRLSQRVVHCAY